AFVPFPPLFGHQYSHCWIDFRHIADSYMNNHDTTYFENSRRATLAQRAYCIADPLHWLGYSGNIWGLTACDGPGGYGARGAPPCVVLFECWRGDMTGSDAARLFCPFVGLCRGIYLSNRLCACPGSVLLCAYGKRDTHRRHRVRSASQPTTAGRTGPPRLSAA